jgi:hypothetical protein
LYVFFISHGCYIPSISSFVIWSPYRVQNGSGAHPASFLMRSRGSFSRVKRSGDEADHSPPSSAEVKNAWSCTSTPPIRLRGVVLG